MPLKSILIIFPNFRTVKFAALHTGKHTQVQCLDSQRLPTWWQFQRLPAPQFQPLPPPLVLCSSPDNTLSSSPPPWWAAADQMELWCSKCLVVGSSSPTVPPPCCHHHPVGWCSPRRFCLLRLCLQCQAWWTLCPRIRPRTCLLVPLSHTRSCTKVRLSRFLTHLLIDRHKLWYFSKRQ